MTGYESKRAMAQAKVEGPIHVVCQCDECKAQPAQEPVGKLQEPTVERAWFTIAELNAWADKKLSENPHWVMPKDEPERNEPPPQRPWVDLTGNEWFEWWRVSKIADETEAEIDFADFITIALAVSAKLKEKNT